MEANPPQLVMIDHGHGRVWAYIVPNKGVFDGAAWLPKRIVQDLNNTGYENSRIQLKSDQEPSIVALQTAIQEFKTGVIPINSPVGESESNGRVENAIRRVQEKVRVLRHQVEQNIKEPIDDNAPIMAWLIRWAAEFISKYSVGDDGRTPYERVRHEQCKVPVVPFGETIMYLPMQTASGSKGEPARKMGIWLGTIERTEETLVGTLRGVIKCRTASRLTKEERWNKELVKGMTGVPWQPVPDNFGQHIPVEIRADGQTPNDVEETESPPKEDRHADEDELEYQKKVHGLHVSRKAILKYGTIEGCPACNVINRRGHLSGKLGYNHNPTCRARMLQAMRDDPDYRRLVHKHEPHQEAGDVEVLTEEQVSERKHNVKRAIYSIEQKQKREQSNLEKQLSHTILKNLLMEIGGG